MPTMPARYLQELEKEEIDERKVKFQWYSKVLLKHRVNTHSDLFLESLRAASQAGFAAYLVMPPETIRIKDMPQEKVRVTDEYGRNTTRLESQLVLKVVLETFTAKPGDTEPVGTSWQDLRNVWLDLLAVWDHDPSMLDILRYHMDASWSDSIESRLGQSAGVMGERYFLKHTNVYGVTLHCAREVITTCNRLTQVQDEKEEYEFQQRVPQPQIVQHRGPQFEAGGPFLIAVCILMFITPLFFRKQCRRCFKTMCLRGDRSGELREQRNIAPKAADTRPRMVGRDSNAVIQGIEAGVRPDPEMVCPICLTGFGDVEECASLPCKVHKLHWKCWSDWSLRQATCPVCRIPCPKDEVKRILWYAAIGDEEVMRPDEPSLSPTMKDPSIAIIAAKRFGRKSRSRDSVRQPTTPSSRMSIEAPSSEMRRQLSPGNLGEMRRQDSPGGGSPSARLSMSAPAMSMTPTASRELSRQRTPPSSGGSPTAVAPTAGSTLPPSVPTSPTNGGQSPGSPSGGSLPARSASAPAVSGATPKSPTPRSSSRTERSNERERSGGRRSSSTPRNSPGSAGPFDRPSLPTSSTSPPRRSASSAQLTSSEMSHGQSPSPTGSRASPQFSSTPAAAQIPRRSSAPAVGGRGPRGVYAPPEARAQPIVK
eukprot:gnl/TRDRNA2_/TRDRNA2_162098_c0_seq1.p1 gnl/TRDRNA2_/TRDRNA2_162098_c0~~gnl/TRDRNA2_/TRDRNA2_162098_c0_seq1.p1  ORF type:complete len:651 (-),score=63.29 gnl/TRDRNA2_/TRDRNA2_162098_c0_seq1:74-2026(-)